MFITAAWMSPGRVLPASRSVRGPAEWRKLAETSNKEQNAYQHLYDLRTSGFESLFSDSHCWKYALAQAEFNGEPPDQNCLDQNGQQKRQKRSETFNQPSQHVLPDIQDYHAVLHKTVTWAESLPEASATENIRKIAKKEAGDLKKNYQKDEKTGGMKTFGSNLE